MIDSNVSLLILADDLTGALDTSVQFVNYDSDVVVSLNPSVDLHANILGIDTMTREASPKDADSSVRLAWENNQGTLLYKKIDSALRGNVAVEIKALLNCTTAQKAIIAPALPSYSRLTIGGKHLFLDSNGQQITVDLVKYFSDNGLTAEIIHLNEVRLGVRFIQNRIASIQKPAIVIDAEGYRDLLIVAKVIRDNPNWMPVGSLGLAKALAEELYSQQPNRSIIRKEDYSSSENILYVAGSPHPVTRAQVEYLVENHEAAPLELNNQLMTQLKKAKQSSLETLKVRIQEFMGNQDIVLSPSQDLIFTGSSDEIIVNELLSEIVDIILQNSMIDTIVTTGGETTSQICRSLCVDSLRVVSEIYPGVVLSQPIKSPLPFRWLIAKSGSFGEIDTLRDIGQVIKGEKPFPSTL
jgi:uncharacterized protein YgbK (DUF1537 family)